MDWMPAISKANMRELLTWWMLLFGLLTFVQWRSKRTAGIPLAYAFGLSLIHAPGAFAASMDYYFPRSAILLQMNYSFQNTFIGFFHSLIGFASFVAGTILAQVVFLAKPLPARAQPLHRAVGKELPMTLLLLSISFFFVVGPVIRRIPSFGSIASAGIFTAIVADVLFCYQAYLAKDGKLLLRWVSASMAFPLVTLLTLGFASFGVSAALNVWMMVFRFYRPRLVSILALVLVGYGCLTLYVNYMRERNSIRASVWGNRDLSERIESITDVFHNFEWFTPTKQQHLETVDLRLNQNDLVGKAVIYMASDRIEFAHGGTLAAAAVAWVPRILWPGKPASGGSGSLVSRFTGQNFAAGTSIGVGQVLELYVNWGVPSLIIGFMIFGLVMGYFDTRAAVFLNAGDYWNFTRWLLPAMGMLNPIGSLTEVVSSVAANTLFVLALHHWVFSKYYGDPIQQFRNTMRGSKIGREAGSPTLPRGSKW